MLPPARDGTSAHAVAHRCAETAGRIIRAAASGALIPEAKGATAGGRRDIVTVTDPAVEHAVVSILAEAYPEHGVLGEETGARSGAGGWLWVIDPIDGTRNFSAGVPWAAFNLALYHDDEPALALTLDPFRDETFYAERGSGTALNGTPVRASDAARLADAVLAFDIGMDDARGRVMLSVLHDLFPGVQALRLPGSVALGLAYVAAGRWDAYVHPTAYVWDFAPGVLLVREAGGLVSHLDGAPITLTGRAVVGAGAGIHAEVIERFGSVSAAAL